MIDPAGLLVIQGRQINDGRRLGLLQNPFGHRLEGLPAGPRQSWRMTDAPQKAAPFHTARVFFCVAARRIPHPNLLAIPDRRGQADGEEEGRTSSLSI